MRWVGQLNVLSRVRIVYDNGDRSPWAISYHQVGTGVPTEESSWGRIKALYD